MRNLRYLLLLAVCWLALAETISAQVGLSVGGDRRPGYWTLGLNLGFSYQTADVSAEPFHGGGLGLTLAKNLYYRPGGAFAFDLRGRYLYAEQYGLDGYRTTRIADNAALNGSRGPDYRNYPAGLNVPNGFAYLNHETRVHELALEGVLSFNRLRERTGVILGLYGGLGLDWYRVSVDQLDAGGNPYYAGYAGLDPNARESSVRRELRNQILDGDYETPADGLDEDGRIGFMPSLGIELGYQFTPRFSMHLGHRLTFAGNNTIDGQRFADSDPDRYHYTHLAARWVLSPGRSRENPPIIRVTEPIRSPYETTQRDAYVRAVIENVRGADQVRAELNGAPVDFDFSGTSFRKLAPLRPGRNELVITATNSAGSDSETVILIREDDAPPPQEETRNAPNVLITEPAANPYRTEAATTPLRASLRWVDNRQDVQLLLNGAAQRFDFDPQTGQLYANLNLAEGENRVEVRAANRWGADQARTTIERSRPQPTGDRPTVRITEPANGGITERVQALLRATITGVSRREDLSVSVNGRNISNFSYDRGILSAMLDLSRGANRIEVRAANSYGSATDAVSVECNTSVPPPPPPPPPLPNTPPPTIRITRPANNAVFSQAEAELEALVQGVRNSDQINFTFNGRRFTTFRYDAGRGQITARLSLQSGNNTVRIEVSNSSGTSQDGINLQYTPAARPTVTIDSPSDGATLRDGRVSFRARTTQVNSRSEIELLHNNRRVEGFDFNAGRQEITATLNLSTGDNPILVRVRTVGGADEDQVRVRFETVQLPTVDLREPVDGRTYSTADINLLAITTRVERSQDVSVWLNEQPVSGITFDAARQEVKARLRLAGGSNRLRIRVQNAGGTAEDVSNVTYRPAERPEVTIIDPVQNPYRSSQATMSVRARTRNVDQRSQLSVTLNGQAVTDFQFAADRNELTVSARLRDGDNALEIEAVTDGGRAGDRRTLQYQSLMPPTVNITAPERGSTVSESSVVVRARILRANQAGSRVVFTVNGQEVSGFQFTGEQFTATVNELKPGENRLKVSATNAAGTESDEVTITYQPPAPPAPKPEVSFVKPAEPGRSSRINRAAVEANVRHAERVTVTINGNNFTAFTHRKAEEKVTFSFVLVKGVNTIVVRGENAEGAGEATTTVIYAPVSANAPTVTISSVSRPVENPMSPGLGPSTVRATVRNITEAGQIVFTANGERITNFTFDARTGEFVGQCQLRRGGNTVIIQATNADGTAEDRREISL